MTNSLKAKNFLGPGTPNWVDFLVDEISFVDVPAVPDADVVALKRAGEATRMKVSEVVEQMKRLTAEQMAGIRAQATKQGNVQGIIDAWDDWAGSFTGCMNALEGKEGITTPEALCAWLHHEATGNWPAED